MKRSRLRKNYQTWIFPVGIIVSSLFLFATSLYSFLLFHTLVELFAVIIAFGIFIVAWSSRRYVSNIFFLLIGIGYFFVGALDLISILSSEGVNIINNYGVNFSTQLWAFSRYLEAASLLAACIFFQYKNIKNFLLVKRKSQQFFAACLGIFIIIVAVIFSLDIFSGTHISGFGLKYLKIYNGYIISFIFGGSLWFLYKKNGIFDRKVFSFLSMAIIMKIFSALLLMEGIAKYEFFGILGYIFRFISYLLLYESVTYGGLRNPYRFLFLDLKKSEERYRALVEFSPDAIIVHVDGKIIYANKPAKKLLGFKKEADIYGAELFNFFGPEYHEHIRLRIKNIFSGKWQQAPTMEMEILHANGRTIPVEVKGIKINYEGKEAVESIIRDVSAKKVAEEKIRSLAKFPEEDPSPVMRVLEDGQVQYANRPAHKMLSHLNWKAGEPLPESLSVTFKEVWEKRIKQEVEVTCTCGKIFSIVFAPSLIEDWVNLYGRDISKRKATEKELLTTQMELRKRIEEQLIESYKHLGLVNRKISLLLELENHSQSKENKQEILEYILSSLLSISYAKVGLLYLAVGKNHFNLVSSAGLEKEKLTNLQVVNESNASFIGQLVRESKRVNGSCELVHLGCFGSGLALSYFVALPILSGQVCKGFLFLGFTDRKSMDVQELEFLDVFAKHVSLALAKSIILN